MVTRKTFPACSFQDRRSRCIVLLVFNGFIIINQKAASRPVGIVKRNANVSEVDAAGYLQNFGYLPRPNPEIGSILSADSFNKGIKQFQLFFQLRPTGTLNAETKQLMLAPRCGVSDTVMHDAPPAALLKSRHYKRHKRYAVQGSRWPSTKAELSWKISTYTNQLTPASVDAILRKAFGTWSQHSRLTFTQQQNVSADIGIKFVTSRHGDFDAFDGPGGVLAHAFFPDGGGDTHFDDAEQWSDRSESGKNLYQIAVHEFGHSLGLHHSNVSTAVMFPIYRGYNEHFQLDVDDVKAIQHLYGAPRPPKLPKETKRPVEPTTTQTNNKWHQTQNVCENGGKYVITPKIDAITRTINGSVYVFIADEYYKVEDSGLEQGYPRKIITDWPGLPNDLDAAVTWPDGQNFFFKENQYWRFNNFTAVEGYPQLISRGFPGIPDNIDSAFVWSDNQKTYFTKDNQYWRYDPYVEQPIPPGYPLSLDLWQGLPGRVDSATEWHQHTHFFINSSHYQFNNKRFSVENGFPRLARNWWFGCQRQSLAKEHSSELQQKASATLHLISRQVDEVGEYFDSAQRSGKKALKSVGSLFKDWGK